MPALIKWSPKVYAMKKIFNQCLLGLKQPKIGEKCHFYDTFKPFLWILTCFGNLNMKWVEQSDIELLTSKYERKHAKVDWITLHSHGNALVIPLIFHVLPQKSRETQTLKKKWWQKLDFWFWYINTNCFSWHFKLKTDCLLLFHYIRPFSGPFIGPGMQ